MARVTLAAAGRRTVGAGTRPVWGPDPQDRPRPARRSAGPGRRRGWSRPRAAGCRPSAPGSARCPGPGGRRRWCGRAVSAVVFGQREDVLAVDEHLAAAELEAALEEPEQGEGDRGLARSRFAHQAEHVPGLDGRRISSMTSASGLPRRGVIRIRRFSTASRGVPWAGFRAARPWSPGFLRTERSCRRPLDGEVYQRVRLGGTAADAQRGPRHRVGERVHADGEQRDKMAGMSTPHGFAIRPTRFSLIISPQLAAGSSRPKPRKLSPAMTSME